MESNISSIMYMLRTAQQHHVQLSIMADQKANALTAASFVTLSITVTYSASHQPNLPLMLVMGFAMLTAMFSVLAVMPRVHNTPRLVGRKNPLFFGDFAGMELDEFIEEVQPLLKDNATVFNAMLQDIYCIGQVLMRRKYRYLGLAYRCFLVGMIAAPVAAVFEYLR